jgi:hypothetical protein
LLGFSGWWGGTGVATHGLIEVRVPKSQSLKTIPSRPSETHEASTRTSATRRIFDTVENLFFKEGDELSKIVPIENELDEITELVPLPRRKRRLTLWIAMAALVLVVALAVVIF